MSNSRLLDRHLNNNICPDLQKGDRIVLIQMADKVSPVPPKSRGTVLKDGVNFFDDIIYSIRWDKSGSLNILSNIDKLKELDREINRSNDESEIEGLKQQIKDIEGNHDIWMFEEDFDNLKNRVKKTVNESAKDVINILRKNKDKFKNYEVDKLVKYLTAIRDASFINMFQASFFLTCGRERTEHETKYTNKVNKKAYQYVLDNADKVRDIMIRGAMKTLEESDKEITPESVERLMRRDAQQFLLLYMTLPIKKQDYPEYDDIEDEDDYYEDGYDEDDDY